MKVMEVVKNPFQRYIFNRFFNDPKFIINVKEVGWALTLTGISDNNQDESGFKRFNNFLRKWVSIRPPVLEREETSSSKSVVGDVYDKIVGKPTYVKKGAMAGAFTIPTSTTLVNGVVMIVFGLALYLMSKFSNIVGRNGGILLLSLYALFIIYTVS